MDMLWTRWEWDWWWAASQSHGKSSQQASQIPWCPASRPKWPIRHVYSSPPPSADAALSGPNEKRWQLWVKLISVAIKTQLSENRGQQRGHSRGKKADKQRRTTRKRVNEETLPAMRLRVVSFKRILYENDAIFKSCKKVKLSSASKVQTNKEPEPQFRFKTLKS